MRREYLQVVVLVLAVFSGTNSKKPIMPGVPLNPRIFEKAEKLVEKEISMLTNDGTMNDIIKPRSGSNTRSDRQITPWPNGIIPYMLDDNFTDSDRIIIAKAVAIFHEVSCVQVVARSMEKNYVLVHKNTKSANCASSVGMVGGQQGITLAERCIQVSGSVMHEFMHAFGCYHEQSREDRDKYIVVHYDNIKPALQGQFNKVSGFYANDVNHGPYDTLSVMHYGRHADAIDKTKDTMTPINGGDLGQRKNLTSIDIQYLNNFYNCPSNSNRNGLVPKTPLQPDGMSSVSETNSTDLENSRINIAALLGCVDYDETMCKSLAKYKYCTANVMFTSIFCKKTCKKCGMGCMDMDKSCKKWAAKNYCIKYADYMHHYCSKSCNMCII